MTRATLVAASGTRHSLAPEGETAIGKFVAAPGVTLVHASVAPRHAVIRAHDGVYTLHDTGSTNGTLVNGEPVRARALVDGDRITCGDVVLVFERSDQK